MRWQNGYYSSKIDKYDIKAEFTASKRVGVSRFTFPKGQSNILLNLGVGLTNEEGAMVKVVSATEIEGLRNVVRFVTTVQKMPIQYICGSVF
jgi:putative alpha-1,2-mannosidase